MDQKDIIDQNESEWIKRDQKGSKGIKRIRMDQMDTIDPNG